jgi:tRNA U34 2-thiouridine synthase MnmA/TrmU
MNGSSCQRIEDILSSFSHSSSLHSYDYDYDCHYDMIVEFDEPMRAVTKGQILALYSGDICLGGGPIDSPGS